MAQVNRSAELTKMRQLLIAHFSADELRTLCFDLRVDYDALPGEGKEGKARAKSSPIWIAVDSLVILSASASGAARRRWPTIKDALEQPPSWQAPMPGERPAAPIWIPTGLRSPTWRVPDGQRQDADTLAYDD